MDLQQNSDFYFVQESFRLFFEKILSVISDPNGIVIQEWMKYKEQLTAKDATPSSIYCYAHQLVINPQENKSKNMVKLKRQNSRLDPNGANTPSRKITRRNSFGSESPSAQGGSNKAQAAAAEGASFTSQVQQAENSGSGSNKQIPENAGVLLERTNQYSPWVDSDRKKNDYQPTQRVNLNEIQQMKGLSEIPNASKDAKNNEKISATKKILLDRVKKCIEQYQKDTVGLDLIHDRSFQTQTMLVDNKRKPYDRTIKRQDSKFIRELSIYSKKGAPTGQPAKELPQGQKDFLKEEQDKFISQKNQETTSKPEESKNTTTAAPAALHAPTSDFQQFDFVKSKHPSEQPPADFLSTHNPPSAVKNYLPTTTTPLPPAYSPSTNIPSYQGLTQPTSVGTTTTTTNPAVDSSKKDNIDDLVQRILREQKEKEKQTNFTSPISEASKGTVDFLKTPPSQGYTSYSPSTTSIPIPVYTSSPYSYTSSIPKAGVPSSSIPSYTSSPYKPSEFTNYSSIPPAVKDPTQKQTTPTPSYTGSPYNPYGISSLSPSNPAPKQ